MMPDDASDDVEAIRVEGLEVSEGPGGRLSQARHDQHDQHEDHRAGSPIATTGDARDAFELVGALQRDQLHGEEQSEHDEAANVSGASPEQVSGPTGAQKTRADAEEARQEHEVSDVGQVNVVSSGPPDQRELDEEHQHAQVDSRHGLCSDTRDPRCRRIELLARGGDRRGHQDQRWAAGAGRDIPTKIRDPRAWLRRRIGAVEITAVPWSSRATERTGQPISVDVSRAEALSCGTESGQVDAIGNLDVEHHGAVVGSLRQRSATPPRAGATEGSSVNVALRVPSCTS